MTVIEPTRFYFNTRNIYDFNLEFSEFLELSGTIDDEIQAVQVGNYYISHSFEQSCTSIFSENEPVQREVCFDNTSEEFSYNITFSDGYNPGLFLLQFSISATRQDNQQCCAMAKKKNMNGI